MITKLFSLTAIGLLALIATGAAPAPSATAVVVTIKDFAFSPSSLTVPVGTTVTWKNADSAAHTVTSTDKTFDSGNLDGGKSYSFTFSKAGTYKYVCSYHSNMTAQVVVQAASASPSPGM